MSTQEVRETILRNEEMLEIFHRLAPWASAAQEDDNCCDELKEIFKDVISVDHRFNTFLEQQIDFSKPRNLISKLIDRERQVTKRVKDQLEKGIIVIVLVDSKITSDYYLRVHKQKTIIMGESNRLYSKIKGIPFGETIIDTNNSILNGKVREVEDFLNYTQIPNTTLIVDNS